MTTVCNTPDFSIHAMRIAEALPEDVRAEVIFGKLYILTQPILTHERITMRLGVALYNYVEEFGLGEVFCSGGVGVYLIDGQNLVRPDIVYLSNNNPLLGLPDRGVFGPSDLHVEVLSPGNRKHDIVRKKQLYEAAGVREYWIIDPKTKDAFGYLLENGKYDEPLILNSKVNIRVLGKEFLF